jgi:large subunit ribosomal protein L13
MATEIARHLRGKHMPTFRPHEDRGDIVVVVNTDRVRVTGNKQKTKLYQWHTWHPRGFRTRTFEQMMEKDSREVVRHAVYGMLPKNRLRDRMITHLKLYKGAEHPHTAAPFRKENAP